VRVNVVKARLRAQERGGVRGNVVDVREAEKRDGVRVNVANVRKVGPEPGSGSPSSSRFTVGGQFSPHGIINFNVRKVLPMDPGPGW